MKYDPGNDQTVNEDDQRRTVRIRRSQLQKDHLAELDRPAIKMAETIDEHRQAFTLLHDSYLKLGYINAPRPHGMLYDHYTLLPETAVFVAKTYLTVISSLTMITDTPEFGLPMDAIYRPELDALRKHGRRLVEMSALVTPANLRWRNLFMYLARVAYWYANYLGIDDICIAVNPKHVRFYRNIFLFEQFGHERHFPKVDAPAVALHIDLHGFEARLKDTYSRVEFDADLYSYFERMAHTVGEIAPGLTLVQNRPRQNGRDPFVRNLDVIDYLLRHEPDLPARLRPAGRAFLAEQYPRLADRFAG
ncbi:MAG: hypothetical protein JW781_11290 [Deltaproteobacteria bacterium]|nr:hypothetical protein [Candidatus Anaeroferrophillacea bacterium]